MLPKTVLVRRRRYKVVQVDARLEWRGRSIRGYCSAQRGEIVVSTKQTKRMILSTFWHELGHAIIAEYRLSGKRVPHAALHDLEGPIADVFLANPQMRRLARQWRHKRPPKLR